MHYIIQESRAVEQVMKLVMYEIKIQLYQLQTKSHWRKTSLLIRNLFAWSSWSGDDMSMAMRTTTTFRRQRQSSIRAGDIANYTKRASAAPWRD